MQYKSVHKATLGAALALVLGMAVAPMSASATSVSGTTNLTVKIPAVVVLDYYSQINLAIDSTAMSSLVNAPAAGQSPITVGATASGTALSTDASISPQGNDLTNVAVTIKNAYAVRSITSTGGGSTSVSVAFGSASPKLTGTVDTTSTIGLSGASTNLGSFTGTGMDPTDAKKGDLTMHMDLSNAKSADTYSGASIVITATST